METERNPNADTSSRRTAAGGFCVSLLHLGDLAHLAAFYERLTPAVTEHFVPDGFTGPDRLADHLASATDGDAISYGLTSRDGHISGHAFVEPLWDGPPVLGIGLEEHLIGCGLGAELMRAALADCDALALPVVTLTVVKTNLRARSLYLGFGFVARGEATFRRPGDSLYMERRLGGRDGSA
jgi:RimJ/RimL family protein N-acetyltransferase